MLTVLLESPHASSVNGEPFALRALSHSSIFNTHQINPLGSWILSTGGGEVLLRLRRGVFPRLSCLSRSVSFLSAISDFEMLTVEVV